VNRCFHQWLVAAVVVLAACDVASTSAQVPSPLGPPADQPAAIDLQSIQRRLEQQDAEIRQLRELVGTQCAPHNLSQFPAERMPALATSGSAFTGVMQTGATMPLTASPAVFELQDRSASAEKAFDPDAPPQGYEVGSDLALKATWRNGVQFESANKDFRFHVGGRVQYDVSAFDNDQALLVSPAVGGIGPQPDSTQFRRARIRLDGTMYEVFDWVAEYDFANTLATAAPTTGQPVATVPGLTELSLTWTQIPVIGNFRVGNQREPMGMEHLTSDVNLPFLERSYLRDTIWGPFNNGYTPGATVFNWLEDQRGTWAVGLYSNQADSFGFGLGDAVAVTGRLTWLPYYDEPTNGAYLWHVGISGSTRNPLNGQVRFRTRGDIRSGPPGVLNPIYADTGTMDASWQNIAGAETAIVAGPLTIQAEYVGTWVEDAFQPITPVPVSRGTPFFQGGYVQALWYLTGEHDVYNRHTAVFENVVPYENAFCVRGCNGECKGWGAWQIGARYNAVDLNDNGINGGVLQSFTFGVNWYWTPQAKVQFNYDLTARSQVKTVAPGDINAWGIRFAYFF
jgi:phosphate-selective porin OprO and OprP